MSATWPTVLALLVTARWWVPLALALFRELRAAAEPVLPAPAPTSRSASRPLLAEDSRVPLNRVLAFRGPEPRARARRRWEAGFGRRGL